MRDRYVSAVVLAAGRSERFGGQNKLLSEYEGTPLVRRAVDAAVLSGVQEVILVVGFEAEEVLAACAGTTFVPVKNHQYDQGLGTSVGRGVSHVNQLADVVVLILADCPELKVESIQRVFSAVAAGGDIAVASDGKKQSPPVAFGKDYFHELGQLKGSDGASKLWKAHRDRVRLVTVSSLELADVDTVKDLLKLQNK